MLPPRPVPRGTVPVSAGSDRYISCRSSRRAHRRPSRSRAAGCGTSARCRSNRRAITGTITSAITWPTLTPRHPDRSPASLRLVLACRTPSSRLVRSVGGANAPKRPARTGGANTQDEHQRASATSPNRVCRRTAIAPICNAAHINFGNRSFSTQHLLFANHFQPFWRMIAGPAGSSRPPTGLPAAPARRPADADRPSRPQRWRDAVAELLVLQADYTAWPEALPVTLLRQYYC